MTQTALIPLMLTLATASNAQPAAQQVVTPPDATISLASEAQHIRASDASGVADALHRALAAHVDGLTADGVAERTVATSAQIDIMRAELMLNASTVDTTISRFAPDLAAEASYSRISPADINFGGDGAQVVAREQGPISVDGAGAIVDAGGNQIFAAAMPSIEVPLNNFSLKASLTVPFSDYVFRFLAARQGAVVRTKAVVLLRDTEKVRVELDARLAYYDWLRAVAQVAVLEQTVEEMRARILDAEAGQRAGFVSSPDVRRMDGTLANTQAGLVQVRSFERLARSHLSIIMNHPDSDFRIGEDIFSEIEDRWSDKSPEALLDEAFSERIELKAFHRNTQALYYAARSARVDLYPRLDGFAEMTYGNPNQRFFPATQEWNGSWVVGASLSWRLSSYLAARSNVKQVEGEKRKLEAQELAMRQAIELELQSALEERTRAVETLTLSARALSAAESVYGQQVSLYQGGSVTTTDVLAANNERLNATLRDVNARIDLRVADAKLARATGRMKPRSVAADKNDIPFIRVPGLRKASR